MTKGIVVVGASRGIGEELVKLFAANPGHHVLALARNAQRMEAIFSEFSNVTVKEFDLEHAEVKANITAIFEETNQIDVLVSNAGKLVNKPFLSLTEQEILSCYQVNVLGVFSVLQSAIPKMLDNGAHVVNISSMGGFQGSVKFPGLSAYSTSKAAAASLTELLAEEYKDSKIAFNCLTLGAAQTEMLEEAFPGYEAPVSAKKMAEFIADFSLNANQWIKGKIIPVSLSTP
jgi:NAD(P)-dependent dehydrogenase (short-subunit alcohol dehydrogenase family)